jgi:hypothetical protein
MDAPDSDRDDRSHSTPDPTRAIAVTVTRTGGLAGLRRTWRAEPQTTDAPRWIALIDECPWDAAHPSQPVSPGGADRYVWSVDARCGDAQHRAALADPDVAGPWRELIDAVVNGGTGATWTPRV